jgi:hypothetical protein
MTKQQAYKLHKFIPRARTCSWPVFGPRLGFNVCETDQSVSTNDFCVHYIWCLLILMMPFCSHFLIIKSAPLYSLFKLLNYLLAVPYEHLICNIQGPSSIRAHIWGKLLYSLRLITHVTARARAAWRAMY